MYHRIILALGHTRCYFLLEASNYTRALNPNPFYRLSASEPCSVVPSNRVLARSKQVIRHELTTIHYNFSFNQLLLVH